MPSQYFNRHILAGTILLFFAIFMAPPCVHAAESLKNRDTPQEPIVAEPQAPVIAMPQAPARWTFWKAAGKAAAWTIIPKGSWAPASASRKGEKWGRRQS